MADAHDYSTKTFAASDGYGFQYRHYPSAPMRGRVVYLHGIQSHAGWYEHSSRRLAASGYEVFFIDRRGSGANQQQRGDTPSFRRLLDDIAEFIQPLRQTSEPIFLSAVSWGGKLALALPRRRPGLIDGIALLCPGFFPKVGLPFAKRMGILRSRMLTPEKLFPIPLNEPELFTTNEKWLPFLRDDSLALREATARFFFESARLDGYARYSPRHITVPILLMLAEQDRIIHNEPTRRLIERCATDDKTIREYPQAHHTLEFEPEPDIFIDELITWLDEQCMKRSSSKENNQGMRNETE